MIPADLRPGSIVRCTDGSYGSYSGLHEDENYTVVGYNRNPEWGVGLNLIGVMLAECPNTMGVIGGRTDEGWVLARFRLVKAAPADGYDYQAVDDVDLGGLQ